MGTESLIHDLQQNSCADPLALESDSSGKKEELVRPPQFSLPCQGVNDLRDKGINPLGTTVAVVGTMTTAINVELAKTAGKLAVKDNGYSTVCAQDQTSVDKTLGNPNAGFTNLAKEEDSMTPPSTGHKNTNPIW
jgi:hypothetical protein